MQQLTAGPRVAAAWLAARAPDFKTFSAVLASVASCAVAICCVAGWTGDLVRPQAPGRSLDGDEDDLVGGYHKAFWPLNSQDYFGICASGLGLMVAAGGGIGGGGVIVPLYILLLGFNPKHAIPLSNVTILGGAIANTLFNCPKRHPKYDRPVIDWDMILVMEPSTIAGAVIGSFIAKFLPEIILTSSLSVLLVLLGWRSLTKGKKMWDEESAKMDSEGSGAEGSDDERASLTQRDEEDRIVDQNMSPELEEIIEAEKTTPWCKVLALTFCFVGCVGLTLLKGSDHVSPLNIECGTVPFWFLSIATIPWVIIFAAIFRCMLLRATEEKEEAGFQWGPGDIEWNPETTIRYPAVCTLAGLFAGLFGVGGGIVKGPLMLEMGVAPSVASATAATMILFTTCAASVSFAVFGLIIDYQYAAALFMLGFFCTVLGQVGLNACMSSSGRQSPIVFSIGLVIMSSAVMVGISTVMSSVGKPLDELFQTDSLCH